MAIQKITELKSEPVVGKFYLVPCVYVDERWVPIIGQPHADPELGVSMVHYHHDIRFAELDDFLIGTNAQIAATVFPKVDVAVGVVTPQSWANTPPKLIKMECRRSMIEFPDRDRDRYEPFHKEYIGRDVKCGRCPHRNMPLESLPQDKDGNVICNGHGLKISMRENKVIQRF